jgi:multisubunit Na+/H+ antiporter MnhG subunit
MRYRGLILGSLGVVFGLISLVFSFLAYEILFKIFFSIGFLLVISGGIMHLLSMADHKDEVGR